MTTSARDPSDSRFDQDWPDRHRANVRGLLFVSTAGFLWGTGGLSVQIIRRHVDMSPYVISAYRTVIAAVALLVLALVMRKITDIRRVLHEHPVAAAVAGLSTGAYQALYFASVVSIGVSASTVISLGTAPVALAVADALRHRRLPARPRLLQLAMALVGLVLVSDSAVEGTRRISGSGSVALGVALAVAAGLGFALATQVAEPVAQRADAVALTTVATIAAVVLLVPLGLLAGGPLVTTNPVANVMLGYLGVATFALAYALLYAGLATTSSHAAVLGALIEPVTAALLAVVILGERLTVLGVAGILLVLAAIAAS